MAMNPTIWLRSGEHVWVEVATDEKGTLSISRIARRTKLLPDTLLLGDLRANEGITIDDVRRICGSTAGQTKGSAVVVGSTAIRAGRLSLREWLGQQLPPLQYRITPVPTVPRLRSQRPDRLELKPTTVLWDQDLWRAVDDYLADAATKDSYHDRINIDDTVKATKLGNEAQSSHVYRTMLVRVGSVLFSNFAVDAEEGPSSSLQRNTGAPNNSSAKSEAVMRLALRSSRYMALKLDDRDFAIVEMKKPSFLRTPGQNIPDLVASYQHKDDVHNDGNRYAALAQGMDHMVAYRVGHGIISSADLLYFVWYETDTLHHVLHISRGIEWQDKKFVAVLSYFLDKVAKDTTVYAGKEGAWAWERGPVVGVVRRGPNMYICAGAWERSMGKGASDLKEMPVGRLHLESHPFVTGWSGNVVRGIYDSVAIAVKLALVGTNWAEALVNEASVYLKLQKCWGTYVLALISYGTTADGCVVYVATEFIVGLELHKGILSQRVLRASLQALSAIHGFGVLHGDIRPQNILVPQSGQQGVRFIDFGFSRAIATEEDCLKELQELLDVVAPMRASRKALSYKVSEGFV